MKSEGKKKWEMGERKENEQKRESGPRHSENN